jgi:hypothetical protein
MLGGERMGGERIGGERMGGERIGGRIGADAERSRVETAAEPKRRLARISMELAAAESWRVDRCASEEEPLLEVAAALAS